MDLVFSEWIGAQPPKHLSSSFPPNVSGRLCTRRSTKAWSSNGGDAARTVADAYDIVRHPLTILMAIVLWSLLSKSKLRRLVIRSPAHSGAPYRIREWTTPSYSRRTPTSALPIFGSRSHEALAAVVTLGTRSLKCGSNVHWLLIVRSKYFIWSPTSTSFPLMSKHRPGGVVPLRR